LSDPLSFAATRTIYDSERPPWMPEAACPDSQSHTPNTLTPNRRSTYPCDRFTASPSSSVTARSSLSLETPRPNPPRGSSALFSPVRYSDRSSETTLSPLSERTSATPSEINGVQTDGCPEKGRLNEYDSHAASYIRSPATNIEKDNILPLPKRVNSLSNLNADFHFAKDLPQLPWALLPGTGRDNPLHKCGLKLRFQPKHHFYTSYPELSSIERAGS
jgi:hypothetical protein